MFFGTLKNIDFTGYADNTPYTYSSNIANKANQKFFKAKTKIPYKANKKSLKQIKNTML